MKHLIIGGVAGGATAATRIRRADENCEIILLEKGPHISYANCGLPYYIGGTIAEREKLFVQTPESFGRRFDIDVRVESEAIGIDTKAKTVTIRKKSGETYVESYDKLLLSPGSVPVRPPLPGIDLEGIFTLRNVEDTDRIKRFLTTRNVRRAVVVGGGFIGLEMAENLHHAGAEVTIVEMAPQVMAPVDFSIASQVHRHLMDKGVRLMLQKGVARFDSTSDGILVTFADGGSVSADIVLLSIGVRPMTQLAENAGIELGERGIKVDKYLQTSAPDVYAVGDAIEFTHPLTGQPWLNYLAGPANRQGRIVADNMVSGNTSEYEGAIGTSIAKVFDITVGATGLPAKRLKQLGIPYASSTTISGSHAGYYPGAFQLTTKLTFDPNSGRLLGAQCVGVDGVDKRIDQLALVIKNNGTIYDLTKLEQAYAPPFSSAKDPIAIAGYAAGNIINGKMPVVYWRDIDALDRSATFLVDTRTKQEFELGHIEGAVNIPLDDVRERIAEFPKDKTIVLYCAVGLRGYVAQQILKGRGFANVYNLSGGFKTYSLATQKIENEAATPAPCIATSQTDDKIQTLDACGLQCPGPIMRLKSAIDEMDQGECLQVKATDSGFPRDARAWCRSTGNEFVAHSDSNGYHTVTIRKGKPSAPVSNQTTAARGKTLIMFSDDLDKAIATFVLANGAAATGQKVTIFFTFWGLNVIKKQQKPKVEKDFISKMFAMMMPSDSRRLKMSKMNMFGMGTKMMRSVMKKKNVDSLEALRRQAIDNGVEFIACGMSMDVMGVKKEELIDHATVGGVATYMERAEQANVNLFI